MSEILVDNLTGKTSAGSITVYSEGGTVTQSLQQGLAKAWVNFKGTGTVALRDSLNGTIVDNGIGDYTINYINNMSNVNYAMSGMISNTNSDFVNEYAGANRGVGGVQQKGNVQPTTLSLRIQTLYGSNASSNGTIADFSQVCVSIIGDLA